MDQPRNISIAVYDKNKSEIDNSTNASEKFIIYTNEELNNKNREYIIEIENLDLFNEIDDLLSLIYNLDMIITSPNLNTHLAGAIGKKCITIFDVGYEDIMNSSLNDGVSEWYKSVKIVQINNDLEKQINKIIKNI